jgi:SAM-dependent methyltransferase
MESGVYAVEAEVEATHWWFAGRRGIFAREIARLSLARDGAVLDIGSGTGANLRLLRDLGFRNATGLDASAEAIRYCGEKGLGPVRCGDAERLPFADRQFDLVLATDVIEHVGDDLAALREIRRVLSPRGAALLTVPAFPSLWGLQDEVGGHKRRYRMSALLDLHRRAGLVPGRHYHFNYLLFAPIWLARRAIELLGVRLRSENELNAPVLNWILEQIFHLDGLTAPLLRPPFGVSALVVATPERPPSPRAS